MIFNSIENVAQNTTFTSCAREKFKLTSTKRTNLLINCIYKIIFLHFFFCTTHKCVVNHWDGLAILFFLLSLIYVNFLGSEYQQPIRNKKVYASKMFKCSMVIWISLFLLFRIWIAWILSSVICKSFFS